MRPLTLGVFLFIPATACFATDNSDTDRYWRPEMRVGPNKADPQVYPKDDVKKWTPQTSSSEKGKDVDRLLAECMTIQSRYQANSYFAPSFRTNMIAAVGTLLGKCSASVDNWENSCVRSGDTRQSCEMKSALIATKALKEAGAQ